MACKRPTKSVGRRGFTLIELLAAMTILAVIVLLLTRVYTDGASALQVGKRTADRNVNARAVMDFIARELSMATFDYGTNASLAYLGMAYYSTNPITPTVFGVNPDRIAFITLTKNLVGASGAGEKRSAYQVQYFLDNWDELEDAPVNALYRYALWRSAYHPMAITPPSAYSSSGLSSLEWMGTAAQPIRMARQGMLIDNVRTFEVFFYTDANGASVADWRSFDSNQDKMAFMDLYLETMDEKDAERLALLAHGVELRGENPHNDPGLKDFADRVVKRNYRRVHLHNKMGWQDIPR